MSGKFSSLDHYISNESQYKLLPFRFENISNKEVVLTNFTGEFIYLNKKTLYALVNHHLSPTDSDYTNLRSRHFIYENGDNSPLELLTLKARTKFKNLNNFTGLHIFVVSLRCDHSCQYCQVSRQSENKDAFDMSIETADKALNLVFQSPNPSIKIEFQGGEPLLNFELIQHIVIEAEIRNKIEKRNLQFVIATTLSLVTTEMLEFCREHNIYLSSSLDGPADLHNKNRPRQDNNSHEKFIEGLKKTRDIVGYDSVSAIMTASPQSLNRVKDIIDEYIKLGFDSIFLRHISPYGFAMKTGSYEGSSVEKWLEFYREGMAYIIDLNKKGIHFIEHSSTIVLTKMLTSNEPGFVDLMNPAGIGIAAIVFNYDGNVYASDESRMLREMGDSTFMLGNVHTSSYRDIFMSDILLEMLEDSFTSSIPMCVDCAFQPWCGADPVFHHTRHGDPLGRKPESEFCNRMMGIFKHLLNLMREDKEVKHIFMRWANRC